MEFRQCTIAGVEYADVVEDAKRGERGPDGTYIGGQQTFEELRRRLSEDEGREADVVREFVALLAVCHTVIPEVKDGQVIYQASSPDEAALVSGAELLGFRFHTRKPRSIFVDVLGRDQEYQILNVCEFNSTRKRMSTIIRTPSGKIKLYCKGADTVIYERLAGNSPYAEATTAHLEVRRPLSRSRAIFG
jgi:phospholipid-transporting ATPase